MIGGNGGQFIQQVNSDEANDQESDKVFQILNNRIAQNYNKENSQLRENLAKNVVTQSTSNFSLGGIQTQ